MGGVSSSAASHVFPAGKRAWLLMFDLFLSSKPHSAALAAEFDLTPQQVYALRQLAGHEPGMGEFAAMLGCDASNVTSIVDRFEHRGLVERRPSSSDRRVKVLALTPEGKRIATELVARTTPPPAIANLSHADQTELCRIFELALASLDERASA